MIRHGYEAYRRRDFSRVLGLMHPDIEIVQTELLPWGGHYRGLAQAQAFFGGLARHIENELDVDAIVPAGRHVAVTGRTRGRVRRNGEEFNLPFVHLWTLREGKAARLECLVDTPGLLRAMGGW